ncbi:MAG TPA: hypothetical protein VFJ14_16520 [Nocardioidaceae bacterium]|nr:hypothetical protein [Nocardioidaceae bacterium]
MSVGLVAAFGAGGLTALAGLPVSWAVITGLALGLPIALFGAGYACLIALEKVPAGVFTPLGLYWAVGFPLAMLSHASVTEWLVTGTPGLPQEPLWQFLAYHALLSVGFAFGFMWAQEQIGRHWWPRIRPHNVYAYRIVEQYKETAAYMHERKEAAKQNRKDKQRARQARKVQPAGRRG